MTRAATMALVGLYCEHPQMTECCEGCGHYQCPDCGLVWDEHFEGSDGDEDL